jgi:NAD(P)H-dependent flavin oxidoreductase YrpB (nitropropane dioxygenase family)
MQTELCKKLGIDFPIFAFSHCRDVVAEASKAGAFGVLGAVGFMPDQFARELDLLDKAVGDRPYGVDIVIPAHDVAGTEKEADELRKELYDSVPPQHIQFAKKVLAENGVPELPEGVQHEGQYLLRSTAATARRHVEIALEHSNVKLIANALGAPPPDLTQQIKAAGRLVAGLCGDATHAKKHSDLGVDVIVAQGSEGGGHTGEIGSIVLWSEVIDLVHPTPVLAAGGIGNGRQIAAALAMGAQGVWAGSVWLPTVESDLTDEAKQLLLQARTKDTVRSRSLTGKPCRMLRNKWTDAWASPESPGTLPLPLQDLVAAEATARAKAYPSKARDVTINPVGQVVGSFKEIRRTRDIVRTFAEEYLEAVEQLNRVTGLA